MNRLEARQFSENNNGPNFQMGYVSAVDAAKHYLLGIPSTDTEGENPRYQHNLSALHVKITEHKKSIQDIIDEYKLDGMTCVAGIFFAYYLGSVTVRNYLLSHPISTRRESLFLFFKNTQNDNQELIFPDEWRKAGRGDVFFDGFETDP